jgi:nickel-dependent lactate racemase
MHDPAYMNENRLQKRVGHEVFRKYTVISHDAYDLKKLKFIGITQTLGTPLFINKAVAEADVKVAVGRIAPHGDMGYSGGYKMIMAGVSGIWSIIHNHTGSLSRRGVLNNPIREDADECGKMAGLNFILNVVYNSRGQTVHAFAGDPDKARLAAIKYGDRYVWGAKKPELAEIVLASPGLRRGDYFMASMGGLGVALTCLKEGGTMILAASCRQGWTTPEYLNSGWHVSRDLLQYDYPELQWLLASKAYNQPKFQFQALVYYVNHIVKNCQEHFVGLAGAKGVDPKELKNIGIHFFESIDSALKYAVEKNGTKARITVIPDNFILPLNSFQTL